VIPRATNPARTNHLNGCERSTARAVDFVFRAALLVLREALRWPVALTAQAYPTHDLATNP